MYRSEGLSLRDMLSLGAWRMGLGCSGKILPSPPSSPPSPLDYVDSVDYVDYVVFVVYVVYVVYVVCVVWGII